MRSARTSRALISILAAMLALVILIPALSCSRMKPVPPLSRRVVVLDFRVPETNVNNPVEVKGWWLGARTVYQNHRDGAIFADILARQLTDPKYQYLEQQSRTDLKFYMGQKRKMLKDKFKDMKPAELERALAEVPPIDYGAELNVDQVITGQILESYTLEHRTVHNWYSKVRLRVDVYDMATGKVVWSREFSSRRQFLANIDCMEDIAVQAARALDKDFYQKQNKPL